MDSNYGYTKKVMDVFMHPKNMGEIENPDAIGKVGNSSCGDLMWMFLRIENDKKGREIIKDVKVKTFGCVAAISTSSVLTEMIKGKPIEDAMTITKQDIVNVLDGLPGKKIHCSILAIDALKEAIFDFFTKKNRPIPSDLQKVHDRVQITNKSIEHSHSK